MKQAKLLLFFCYIVCCLPGYAQQTVGKITGVIVDRNSEDPIEQATIRLITAKDSSFISGTGSDEKGNFSLKTTNPGSYLLHISFLGFSPLYHPIEIKEISANIETGRLFLSGTNIDLEEAVVTAKAPEIIIRNDTIEYNADSYRVTEGAVLEDLLKRLPGAEVQNGKITLNGKEITKILVDGKEFFSTNPTIASQNLPADMIDKIQTYEKKSETAEMTGFDDGNNEQVINLTIKPEKKKGWFGNTHNGYGSHDRYEANAMVNQFVGNDVTSINGSITNTNGTGINDMGGAGGPARIGAGLTTNGNIGGSFNKEFSPKLDLNVDMIYSHSDNDVQGKSRAENILSADSSIFEDNSNRNRTKYTSIGSGIRLNWQPDSLTTIMFRPDFSYDRNRSSRESVRNSYNQYDDPVFNTDDHSSSKTDGYGIGSHLYLNRKLNSKGRMVNIALSGQYNDSTEDGYNQSLTNYFQRTDDITEELLDQQFRYNSKGKNYSIHVAWIEPLGKSFSLQASYNLRYNNQESLKNTYSIGEEGLYSVLDSAYSQSNENRSVNQSANVSLRSQREKYDYQIGLNIDPTYNENHTFVGDSTISRLSYQVVNYSPSAYFSYRFSQRTNLRIHYHGATSQPSIRQLQPIPEIISSTHTRIGNPDLKPSYRSLVSLHFFRFDPESQRTFMISADGNYTLNAITTKSEYAADGSGNRITGYENVNGNYMGNFRFMWTVPFKNKKFSFNTSTMASYGRNTGFINAERSINKTLGLQEIARLNYHSERLDLAINGNLRYNNLRNNLQTENNRITWNYNVGGYAGILFPWELRLENDIYYSGNAGYSDGYKQKELLWNASLSKSFLKNNQATIRLKFYDILQQQTNISRVETASYIIDSEYNSLGNYFMVYFIYRFQLFPGAKI